MVSTQKIEKTYINYALINSTDKLSYYKNEIYNHISPLQQNRANIIDFNFIISINKITYEIIRDMRQ